MKNAVMARANYIVLLTALTVSGATMIWLFWHHPIKTVIGTLGVLLALGVSARLARAIEAEASAGERSEQSI